MPKRRGDDSTCKTREGTTVNNQQIFEEHAQAASSQDRSQDRCSESDEARKKRRKQQCMLNQRRYRARQRGLMEILSLETVALRAHIDELEAYVTCLRELVQTATLPTLSMMANEDSLAAYGDEIAALSALPKVVVEQFLLIFQRGFALHNPDRREIQERFLRFVMEPVATSQGASNGGPDALILQLQRYSSYHASFEMSANRLQHVRHGGVVGSRSESNDFSRPCESVSTVLADGDLRLLISSDTITSIYPHLMEDSRLSRCLLDQELAPPVRLVFCFNCVGKVTKFEMTVNFVDAFMQIVPRMEDVCTILERARISPFSELGVNHDGTTRAGQNHLDLEYILC